MIKLFKSPAIMASGVTSIFFPENPDKLCHRIKFLLQEKHAGNISDIFIQEIIAIVDKLIEYKSISKKHFKQILIKCNLLHELV